MTSWSNTLVMLSMFGQVILTFYLYVRLFKLRVAWGTDNDKFDVKSFVVGKQEWPDKVIQHESALKNQFEAPVLFYAACATALAIQQTSFVFAALAVAFVGCRIWHVRIHTGHNLLKLRIRAFSWSLCVIFSMWMVLVGHYFYGQIT